MGAACSRGFSEMSDDELCPQPNVYKAAGMNFATLLEAFEFCDPHRTGYIKDHERFAQVARALTSQKQANAEVLWRLLDQDGNGAVSFPEFVEWAELHQVTLPVGLRGDDEIGPGGIAFPHTWKGPKNIPTWNKREIVMDGQLFLELQQLINVSYRKVWTRDRKATGVNKVPSGYILTRAMHSENYADWRRYYLKRHQLVHDCATTGFFERRRPITAQAAALSERHRLRYDHCNEWLLFHGTTAESAERICGGDFHMHWAGSATGTLYGRGTYFAESITKADEYSKPDREGNCCVLVCRVVGGRVLYNDEVNPDAQKLQDAVLSGSFHSILGDREKCRGTFKEYVIFDADQVYVEYALFYQRSYSD
mmetsp:Transcript_75801/g.190665  ORF Transcript_75801/g.190665 Transcript_75801/m.190665 type:complete len:366 (-) Transcript_75801:158-1255(-)